MKDSQVEPFLTSSPEPLWSSHPESVHIAADLPTIAQQTDRPENRQAEEHALAATHHLKRQFCNRQNMKRRHWSGRHSAL